VSTWVDRALAHCDRPDEIAEAQQIVRDLDSALRTLLIYFTPTDEASRRAQTKAYDASRKYKFGP